MEREVWPSGYSSSASASAVRDEGLQCTGLRPLHVRRSYRLPDWLNHWIDCLVDRLCCAASGAVATRAAPAPPLPQPYR